ncbi:MAG TPA: hypothetical protein PLJ42_12035 [Chitinophagales bacterium]|jgi:hypothetical protein|nr:hypothetical protein [Chitinophagales bacterium]MBP6154845.1 hypothetical protein [Chitinophagales bacterium]HQV78273.1 hypothetical protein [Chitinophagales bacterium]HQW80153.1 hypothetical protein [Chitinophagales bacterium]HRB92235.1 hypothetical protein [Chitinophagales bacterium]
MQNEFIEEDIRLVDVLESITSYLKFLLKKWYISILGVAAFTAAGYFFAKLSAPKYVNYVSFNAVDTRTSAMGGLMSMMGVTFAGGSSNDVLTGIFTSRNIFLNSMLTDVEINGKTDKLANFYFHTLKYDEGFEKDPILKDFKFRANSIDALSKQEIDFLGMMYDDFIDGFMTAEYDIPTGMIKAEIETPDYDVSRQLGVTLLNNTIKFYQNRQVENAKTSLTNSTKRLDSISAQIEARQRMIAASQDQNIFNSKRISIVEQQKLTQEMMTLNVMYNDAVTATENSKAGLSPQNNIVRIIDDPLFSTSPKYKGKWLFAAIGFAVSIFVIILPLIMRKAILDGREENKIAEEKLAAQQQAQATSNS